MIPDMVENCVHMVAMHEYRNNFPLESIRQHGQCFGQKSWMEVAYPGSHSDVGGGCSIGEMGIAMPSEEEKRKGEDAIFVNDAKKLSQIPLLHMYACAKKVCVPFNIDKYKEATYNPFAIHHGTEEAFNIFLQHEGVIRKEMSDWAQTYLNWRYHCRNVLYLTYHYRCATSEDKRKMRCANTHFLQRINTYLQYPNKKSKAYQVYVAAKNSDPVHRDLANFFDRYVHDSYAGFTIQGCHVGTPYLHCRKIFAGTDKPYNEDRIDDEDTSGSSNCSGI